jgi:hypothetical protein
MDAGTSTVLKYGTTEDDEIGDGDKMNDGGRIIRTGDD